MQSLRNINSSSKIRCMPSTEQRSTFVCLAATGLITANTKGQSSRIRDTLMQNQSLLEVLSLDRKILEKPPNWNLPVQEELFSPLLL